MMDLSQIKRLKRVVIKIGSNVLTDHDKMRNTFFKHLADQVAYLVTNNIEPVIVSSGAIAAAMSQFKQFKRPQSIPEKQAYAAIGQPILMNLYANEFQKKNLKVGQILLTQEGLDDRVRFINAKHALNALIANHIIPIVNENDTVTVDEIKIGDNDQLSAHVACLVEADLLIILSHVEGLYDKNPQKYNDSQLIPMVHKIDANIQSLVFESKEARTTGGMATKLKAARICMDHGIPMFITSGFQKDFITKIFDQGSVGTYFQPSKKQLSARKRWIRYVRKAKGQIFIDAGAKKALVQANKSLLPTGITQVSGDFHIGDTLEICDHNGHILGRGLASYNSQEVKKIMGRKSTEIEKILGYKYGDAVVHRDDLVLED